MATKEKEQASVRERVETILLSAEAEMSGMPRLDLTDVGQVLTDLIARDCVIGFMAGGDRATLVEVAEDREKAVPLLEALATRPYEDADWRPDPARLEAVTVVMTGLVASDIGDPARANAAVIVAQALWMVGGARTEEAALTARAYDPLNRLAILTLAQVRAGIWPLYLKAGA